MNSLNKNQIWIPEGIAHGFMALTTKVELLYKTTDFWDKDLGTDNLYPTGPTALQFGFEKYFNNYIQYNKNAEYILFKNNLSVVKKEIDETNKKIVQSDDSDTKQKLEIKKNNLINVYFLKKKKIYDSIQKSESVFIGNHKRDDNNVLYFYDHNNTKIIKTKYNNMGKEFSAGEWDKFPEIKGNNYNILWMRNQVYTDKKYPLYYNKPFNIFLFCLLVFYINKAKKSKYFE